jgi:hypothetical protein
LSIQFNDTTNYKGLVQLYEREMGYDAGYISGNTQRLKQFAADSNLAWDEFMKLAAQASGTWQFDDSGHGDYPLIYLNIVSGQRDYNFTTDETGNLVLDFYKVGILQSSTDTEYVEISGVDQQSGDSAIFAEDDATGTPIQYDKTANGIFLDPIPNYSVTKGIKIAINREASYFTYSDTTKKPGVPGSLQSWFYKFPAFEQAKRKGMANRDELARDIEILKRDIKEHFAMREKDVRHVMRGRGIQYI